MCSPMNQYENGKHPVKSEVLTAEYEDGCLLSFCTLSLVEVCRFRSSYCFHYHHPDDGGSRLNGSRTQKTASHLCKYHSHM